MIVLCVYFFNMRERATASYIGESVSNEDGGLYTAKYYLAGPGGAFMRLYRNSDGVLVAERMFDFGDSFLFIWKPDRLHYSTSDPSFFYNGEIALPPSCIDRLLARLP